MPDIAKVLKEEITRLARKEIRVQTASLSKDNRELRRAISKLKKELAAVQVKINRCFDKPATSQKGESSPTEGKKISHRRITAKGLRSLRKRLKLSQKDFAILAGVSGQAVYQWERKDGALRLRNTTRQAISKMHNMGVNEARANLNA